MSKRGERSDRGEHGKQFWVWVTDRESYWDEDGKDTSVLDPDTDPATWDRVRGNRCSF